MTLEIKQLIKAGNMINERKLRVNGAGNIPKDLELGKAYDLVIENAEVRKSEEHPNDNGTINRVYTLRVSEF